MHGCAVQWIIWEGGAWLNAWGAAWNTGAGGVCTSMSMHAGVLHHMKLLPGMRGALWGEEEKEGGGG